MSKQKVEEVPSPFAFLKIFTDDKHPAVMSILHFSFVGLAATLIFMYLLPEDIIEKKFVIIFGVLSLGLFLALQYWFHVVDIAKKELETKKN